MFLTLLAYYGIGVLLDICYTIWYAGIAEKNVPMASTGSFLVTILGYTLVYELILGPSFFLNLLAYATGCSIGTGVTVWYKNRSASNHN
jgi:hypothetical protein